MSPSTTVAGQALAWWIVGFRQLRAGSSRSAARTVLAAVGAALLVSDRLITVLDRSPTTLVVTAMANAYAGELVAWLPQAAALGLATCCLCGWGSGLRVDSANPDRGLWES